MEFESTRRYWPKAAIAVILLAVLGLLFLMSCQDEGDSSGRIGGSGISFRRCGGYRRGAWINAGRYYRRTKNIHANRRV